MVAAAVWVALRMDWCGFVVLIECRRSAGWFGGWWAGLVGWFCLGCVWDGRLEVGGSRCRWVAVGDVNVFGSCWGCGGFSWGQRGGWWWVWVARLGALVVHGVGWECSILSSGVHSSRVEILCGGMTCLCHLGLSGQCNIGAAEGHPARWAG